MKLLISIISPFIAAAIGSFFTYSEIQTWYSSLNKPLFSPPNWLFGPVWTLLYTLMGISFYLFWKTKPEKKDLKKGLLLFSGQLVLNALWSIIFFGLKKPGLALVEIIVLWFVILANILFFNKYSKSSAFLLVPYILWVSFASVLNFAIWRLN